LIQDSVCVSFRIGGGVPRSVCRAASTGDRVSDNVRDLASGHLVRIAPFVDLTVESPPGVARRTRDTDAMDATKPAIYMAGPLGFTAAGRLYHETVLLPAVRAAGFVALDPWDVEPELNAILELPVGSAERLARLPEVNRAIGERNARLIDGCAAVLAVLDGNDVDSGTAAEIGYAAAKRKPVVGLRCDHRVSGDNEATLVNLQVEWFIVQSGGQLETDLGAAIAAVTRVTHA
jgi:nucleoside 2-deoxyribosyltransferase